MRTDNPFLTNLQRKRSSFAKFFVLLTTFFLCAVFAVNGFALTVTGTAPTGGNQTALNTAFGKAVDELNKDISKISSRPLGMVKGFGDAAVFGNHAATQRGYLDYKRLAFTAGTMAGLQVPGVQAMDIMDLHDNLIDNGDAKLGAHLQVWSAELGLHSDFLLEGLYLGFKFGFCAIDIPISEDKMEWDYWNIGFLARYRFLGPVSARFASWNGLSVGTGLLYSNAKTNYSMYIGDFSGNDSGVRVDLDSSLYFAMKFHGWTMPLEIMTAVDLFFLTIHGGFGVDINWVFGKMDIGIKSSIESSIPVSTPGSLTVGESMDNVKPTHFRPKLMAGLGFNAGAVVLDIPFTFYIGNGFSLGVSIGFVY